MTMQNAKIENAVIPAKAGIQGIADEHWIPAFAGMTRLVILHF